MATAQRQPQAGELGRINPCPNYCTAPRRTGRAVASRSQGSAGGPMAGTPISSRILDQLPLYGHPRGSQDVRTPVRFAFAIPFIIRASFPWERTSASAAPSPEVTTAHLPLSYRLPGDDPGLVSGGVVGEHHGRRAGVLTATRNCSRVFAG